MLLIGEGSPTFSGWLFPDARKEGRSEVARVPLVPVNSSPTWANAGCVNWTRRMISWWYVGHASIGLMATQISPMLAVGDGDAAIEFYKTAFGATVMWHLESDGHVVAGLSVDGAQFFLATESPDYGTRDPASVGFTTVRIELFVDDPIALHRQALAAGAADRSPVVEHTHSTSGPQPIKRMLQGSVVDPFGHMWLIGKILE